MPRAIDLSKLPPPEATCYACGKVARLDRRARARERFRCPYCHTDNRVSLDGQGRALRGAAEQAADMPQVRCAQCGATNRLPRHIIDRGRYVCYACHHLQPVPGYVLRKAGVVSWWRIAAALLLTALVLTWAWGRIAPAVEWVLAAGSRMPPVDNSLAELDGGGNTAQSSYTYVVSGHMLNPLPVPATFYWRINLVKDDRTVVSRVVAVKWVPPGAQRSFTLTIVDRSFRQPDGATWDLVGVS